MKTHTNVISAHHRSNRLLLPVLIQHRTVVPTHKAVWIERAHIINGFIKRSVDKLQRNEKQVND